MGHTEAEEMDITQSQESHAKQQKVTSYKAWNFFLSCANIKMPLCMQEKAWDKSYVK